MSEKIQDKLLPDEKLKAGIGLLGTAEWQQIQAFSDSCIFLNPSTRAMMETAIGYKKTDAWEPKFDAVIVDYGKLKQDCELFEKNVKTEMLAVAGDLCEYATLCKTVYSRLSSWMYDFPMDGIDTADFARKFETLAKGEWGKKSGISPEAETLKKRFTKFLGELQTEALQKKKRVDAVTTNLNLFETSLKTREAAFIQHKTKFDADIVKFKDKIDILTGKIKDTQMDVAREEKADYDKIMVLKTSPVYLLIPFAGPFIMAGILLSVGIATGVLRKKLEGLVQEAQALKDDMGAKVTQMSQTQTVAQLVATTLRQIELIRPEVKKLSLGWEALAAEVGNVAKYVSGSLTKAEIDDWDTAGMNLENATNEWLNVYKKADMLRQFSGIKAAKSIDEAIEHAKKAA